MNVVVFCGPTLDHARANETLEATYCPPAAFGDVYLASLAKPVAIGIVDGYFESRPAIWHKEVLWAMRNGIHVFGAASMGALRAVELEPFGMVGVGEVFKAYKAGAITDDDEVAISHGPEESGFKALSTAMVDIRATLAKAETVGIISTATRAALAGLAKGLPFRERGYRQLLREAERNGLADAELARLREWLPNGQIHQKREDALALLAHLKQWLARQPAPKAVQFRFAHTDAWNRHAIACEPTPKPRARLHDTTAPA